MKRMILITLLALSIGGPLDTPDASPRQSETVACFPVELWSLPDKAGRPCYRVSRPEEDGSGTLRLTERRYSYRCAIPNPAEERATFRIVCREVAR